MLTQKEFGKIIGVKQATVYKYEKGMASPGDEVLKKIADHGGVTEEYLLSGEEALVSRVTETSPPAYSTIRTDLDTVLLTAVLTIIEEILEAEPLNLIAAQKTRLILRVYDDCRTKHIEPTHHQVKKLLYLVD